MTHSINPVRFCLLLLIIVVPCRCYAQRGVAGDASDTQFGPVMRAYLGYLRNEQEVVDDRASRREITPTYYRRNSNRIHALRQMAVRLVRRSGNDYVPELEAITPDEFGILFDLPPRISSLHPNGIVADKFRFLGSERFGETFYLFARLDPYEQAELIRKRASGVTGGPSGTLNASGQSVSEPATRTRRVIPK